ncbi:GGDEF domain-containing protein [Pseudomonas alliivorans]|uniref:diguanylate cyclase n=1 Tax=Pseudomonas alliivorans TaxID=2810613 RepID=A0ABS4C0M6_9PSED|nr:GGDEF domain-containing protein [Pseudomonas alliivorans]MBP0944173.1 GGDEF domain-containing protein [Pseudomonas alliivorans]MEE4325534.1 GGDEF domain-containing protein [Pseudomonas alliivorans]MEE4332190.1 GGDEF domain-containing protein [Pseudomonas alliivorans]MEE4367064.1 GGDEF domain-containing protein [Pseudomonas alliivorans]MEE4372344.1 GGDEF domain-containing protein [Pseudomonas alliivorans]
MNREMQARIKNLLSPAVALAQCLAILCWVIVLLVTPGVHYGALEVVLTLGLLSICAVQCRARHFKVWRLASVLFVVVVACCFARASQLNSAMGINWALPIAVMIILGSTLLMVYTRDYVLVTMLSWIILSPAQGIEPGTVAYIFIALLFIASTSLGILLNHTYTRTIRNVLSLESRFRELSLIDHLTDILNRRALMEALEEHLAARSAGYFLMLDIDDFKRINDESGHDAGDEVLRCMASCLKRTAGSLAYGRLGGEEFGVILPVCNEHEARNYVNRLLDSIRQAANGYPFTCSAGLAEIDAQSTAFQVLKTADINLYQAKGAGKDMAFWKNLPLVDSTAGCPGAERDQMQEWVPSPGVEP